MPLLTLLTLMPLLTLHTLHTLLHPGYSPREGVGAHGSAGDKSRCVHLLRPHARTVGMRAVLPVYSQAMAVFISEFG